MSRANNREKYKEYDHNYYIKNKRPKSKIGQAELKIADLEAKLAEKEEQLRAKIGNMKTNDFIKMCLQCGFMVDAKEKDNQDKISFAIEQLEKVKEFCDNQKYQVDYEYYTDCWATAIDKDSLLNIIDNLINELKGEIR